MDSYGDIVPEDHIHGDNDLSLGETVDPANWRRIVVQAPKSDGGYAEGELLRPLSWLTERGARLGGTIYIAVPECGIEGEAKIIDLDPCPAIKRFSGGRVVTGVWRHQTVQVLDVYIEGIDGPIGTTANHPFWSEDRQAFVRADALHEGEHLWTIDGRVPQVTCIERRVGRHTVYNLEVQLRHVFHVGRYGVLVHNARPCPEILERFGSLAEALEAEATQQLHVRLGHDTPKRIALPGEVNPRNLGSAKQYSHRIRVEAKPGATEWLREHNLMGEIPGHDGNRVFAIPAGLVEAFNENWVIGILIEKVR